MAYLGETLSKPCLFVGIVIQFKIIDPKTQGQAVMTFLRVLRSRRAQSVLPEYILVFFVVIGMISAMTVYFSRAVQSRIRDARNYAVKDIRDRTKGYYSGNLYVEYEPYYTDTDSRVSRNSNVTTQILPGISADLTSQSYDEETRVDTFSNTAAPRDADKEYQ